MRALIGPDILRDLEAKDRDIRDTKLTGFVLRCRASGQHSYLVQLGRGRWSTIGRVGKITPEAARLTADAMISAVSKNTLNLMAEDPTLALRDARAKARGALRPTGTRRSTWGLFLDEHYGPWVTENRKTGDETLDRLKSRFAEFEALRLSELSGFAIEKWRSARLKAGVKPTTVNRDFAALRGALSKAVEWKLLKVHPMADVKDARTDRTGRIRYLDPAEETRLLKVLDGRDDRRRQERDRANAWRREREYDLLPTFGPYTDHLTPLVLVALHTGCRRGELLDLRWQDADLVASSLTVRGETAKSKQTRVLPLNATAVKVLRSWRPANAERDAYVFPGRDGGRMDDLKTAFLRLIRAADIRRFRFHDLRHTFASKLVMAGVDLNTVRELLGHSDIKMTLRYAHLAPEHKAAAVAKLVEVGA
jgi:integrase